MLKVVIADDERIQREGIAKHIVWHEFSMELVGRAEDGIEALELIKKYHADILITDIKMPKMNGLELSQKAKELYPHLKIMMISGYDEFEFVRAAIELNAYSFMLKPINMQQLKSKLEKIGFLLETQQKTESELISMKKQLEESKPLLVDKFIKDLLYGFLKDQDIINKRAEFLSVSLFGSSFYVLLIQIDDLFGQEMSETNKQLFYLRFFNYLVDMYTKRNKGIAIQSKESEFVLILYNDDLEDQQTPNVIENMRENLYSTFNKTITISVSSKKDKLIELNESYREAEVASRQKFYLGKGKTLCFQDINNQGSIPISLEEKYEKLIVNVGIGSNDKVEEMIDDIFSLFSHSSGIEEQYVKAFCFRVMSDIYRILYDMNEKAEDFFGKEELLWSEIYRFDTIPVVRQWLKNILTRVTQHIFNKRSRKNSSVVEAIIQKLEQNYNEQITIEELAQKVFLTPNYICNIFKESIGETIIDYLTKVRMRHAKRLLLDTEAKIYEVAEKTGFNSTSYFSVVFKNMFGLSPKEFRENRVSGV